MKFEGELNEEELKFDEKNRKLSKAEKKRLAKYKEVEKEMLEKGYEKHEFTVSLVKANMYAFFDGLPFILIFFLIYYFVGNKFTIGNGIVTGIIILLNLIVSTIVHEGLHGLGYLPSVKNPSKEIEFGFIKEMLTPYCVCNALLRKHQYLIGLLMPFFVLGVCVSILGIVFGSLTLLISGSFQIMCAGGDLLVAYLTIWNRSKKKDVLYHDHPTQCGVVMFDK